MTKNLVYFFHRPGLPEVKIGITTEKGFYGRWNAFQSAHGTDIQCLGVIVCESRKDAFKLEAELHSLFNLIRPKGEVVSDSDELRHYIREHAVTPERFLKASHETALGENRTLWHTKYCDQRSDERKRRRSNDPEWRERQNQSSRKSYRKRMNDPEKKARHNERSRKSMQKRRETDPEYRERNRQQAKAWREKQKQNSEQLTLFL